MHVLLDASVDAETLRQARQIIEQHPAVVDDVREKGPGYALGDAGVAIIPSDAASLDEALAAGIGQQSPSEQLSTSTEERKEQDPQ